jgi:hypothetical protein
MKNYSPRQKTFTPPSVQSSSSINSTSTNNNVMQSSTRQKKVEFYSGARFDTFLPSASALPMPPVQWIDPTQRSQSTPSSPIPKNSISATKSIDIAAMFASTPSANGREQPKMTGKTSNNVNGNKQILKSNSYPGEKMLRNKFEQQQQQNKKVVKNNNNDYNGQKPRNQNNRMKQQQQQQKEKPTAATSKTFISTAATSVNSTTTTSTTTKPEIPVKKPVTVASTTVPQSPVSGKDISLNLMAMLGVTPIKSPPKRVEERKSPGYDYEFYATRPGSPEKYKEITNNLKLLLKVQA